MSQECEKLEKEISELRSVVAPVTERFCSVETKVKQLLSRVQGFQNILEGGVAATTASTSTTTESSSQHNKAELSLAARISIGVYGLKNHGKSTLVNAILGAENDLISKNTKVPLVIIPSKNESKPCLRLPDGKALAADEKQVRKIIAERSVQNNNPKYFAANARLHVDLDSFAFVSHQTQNQTNQSISLSAPLVKTDVPWCIVDHPPQDKATGAKFSSAALSSLSPVEFHDDIFLYVVDARVLATKKEVDIFDNLVFLHHEEKSQLRAASSFSSSSSSSSSKKNDNNDNNENFSDDENNNNDDNDDENKIENKDSSLASFVSSPATRRRLLTCTYFFLTHMDCFPDSETVLARGGSETEKENISAAQVYDEKWTATHGQTCPPAKTAEAAIRRFSMLAEFVFGTPIPARQILAISSTGIVHCKVVLGCRNLISSLEGEKLDGDDSFFRKKIYGGSDSSSSSADPSSTISSMSAAHAYARSIAGMTLAQVAEQDAFIEKLYQFAEWYLGSKFMARADHLPFDELRRICLHFAGHRAAATSGGKNLDALMSTIVHNLTTHFFLGICNTAAEITDSLEAARILGEKIVASELNNARDSETILVKELHWVRNQISAIQVEARNIPQRAATQLENRLSSFRDAWLEELRDIFVRKPLEWFKSRQIATVRDIQAALTRYDDFSEQFSSHHKYLHSLLLQQQQEKQLREFTLQQQQLQHRNKYYSSLSGGGGNNHENNNNSHSHSLVEQQQQYFGVGGFHSNVSVSSSSEQQHQHHHHHHQEHQEHEGEENQQHSSYFIKQNLQSLYDAAIKSRSERFHEINCSIAHHLRDELLHFLRDMSQSSTREQTQWLNEFAGFCKVPIRNAKSRFFSNQELQSHASFCPEQQFSGCFSSSSCNNDQNVNFSSNENNNNNFLVVGSNEIVQDEEEAHLLQHLQDRGWERSVADFASAATASVVFDPLLQQQQEQQQQQKQPNSMIGASSHSLQRLTNSLTESAAFGENGVGNDIHGDQFLLEENQLVVEGNYQMTHQEDGLGGGYNSNSYANYFSQQNQQQQQEQQQVTLVSENLRLLNNFTREIVDPITSAQNELVVLEEEESLDSQNSNNQKNLLLQQNSSFPSSSSLGSISTTQSQSQESFSYNNNNTSSSSNIKSALVQLQENKKELVKKRKLQQQQLEIASKAESSENLIVRHKFLYDAWTLTLFSLRIEQVASFDLAPFIEKVASLTAESVRSMAEFSEILSIGIEEHAEIVLELQRDQNALKLLRRSLPRVEELISVKAGGRFAAQLVSSENNSNANVGEDNYGSNNKLIRMLQKRLNVLV